MITVQKAVSIIKSSVKEVNTEYIDVLNANGRVLASTVKALIDSPPFDMSSMDGYAIKTRRIASNNKFKQAVRVFTGSRIPKGTNRIIIQENCREINSSEILVNYYKKDELFIRKKGQDFKKGT